MVPVSNGFFSTGSIFKPVLLADALHMLEHGGAAGAHELHVARIPVLAERDDAFDGFGRFDRDIEKHEVGGAPGQRDTERCAVGELLRVDAAAMQDERKEMPDAAVNVGDEAEWRAHRHAALRRRTLLGWPRILPAPVLRSLPRRET
jgi:hypothetical protein